ncbi:hypothetical protein ASC61_00320 [Aeromicrobium sp. Root344]|uniref:hypothetical protein n=1 Tax=Aeromicrobium sp. Root344 TaxID=1736521 RepID=UPI0006FCB848|nr:hypothetical protein [Aeromicrobium sp. Root344]KQV73585.1 hypothetical protein ASC61_00320 [Aeromicrobium sp. Root344]
MSGLAVLLAAIGMADLVRRWKVATGFAVTVAGLLVLGGGWHTVWLSLVFAVVVVVWVDAASHDSSAGVILLSVASLALVVVSGVLDFGKAPLQDWYDDLPIPRLQGVPLDRAALGVGVVLFLATAANVVVRRVLLATGPRVLAQGDQLRGGRVLGPLERWFVLACALSGNLAAIAVVVAAKGILRFPEISRDGPDGLRAEYVLVGSFVSWALALVFVPLF